jgi:uncharacterized repeat protein (TIGR03803 family)
MAARMCVSFFLCICVSFTTGISFAQETILHSFNGNNENDGNEPVGPVIFDSDGNLYGTTFNGGLYGWGTVFKLSPGTGGWSETTIFNFNGVGAAWPSSRLTFDAAGNLYGTTFFGGLMNDGVAFKLAPLSDGPWSFSGLHDFSPYGHDGTYPRSGLIFDKLGNAYGTTTGGGTHGNGTVFQLTPNAEGGWNENILHSFNDTDGWQPTAGLAMDDAGNLYGTTGFGGSSSACDSGCGVVFEVSPNAEGGWSEKVIFNFNSTNGASPFTPLTIDAAGNLYGTTGAGAPYGLGNVFELSHASGEWKQTILHNFNSSGTDGSSPFGFLALDASGNVFGVTGYGGTYGVGTVFELSAQPNGKWSETILYNFDSNGSGGYYPGSGPVLDSSGNLYGTTENGGTYGDGTVYEIVR